MSKDSRPGPQASSGIGLMLVAAVVLFAGAGYGLDRWLNTGPWLMVAGVFVGFGLGLAYLVFILKSEPSSSSPGEGKTGNEETPDKRRS